MREVTNAVDVERDVKVHMPDGAVLLADIWHPVGVDSAPTILERTPYGRTTLSTWDPSGQTLAERGYRFILQAVRGTDGSEGSQSFFAERDDGRATADWIAAQPWSNGRLGHLRVELHGLHAVGAGVDRPAVPGGDGHLAVVAAVELVPRGRSRTRADDQLGSRAR